MGMGRRAMVYLGLAEEDEEYLDDEYDEPEDPPARERPVRRIDAGDEPLHARRPSVDPRPVPSVGGAAVARRPAPAAAPTPADEPTPYRITTLQPRSYNDARQIGEEFREATPVIMNLTEMDDDDAKRLVDFAAGLIFGLRGKIEKVTNKVFLLSPNNVVVTETDRQRIREGGFYNQS